MNGPLALPVLSLVGRINSYGTADCAQGVQAQAPTHSPTGAGASVCRAPLPGTLQRRPARAAVSPRYRRVESYARRPTGRQPGGATRLAGLSRRALPAPVP